MIKRITGVSDVVEALLTTAKCIFSRLVKYACISSHGRQFLAGLVNIALKVTVLFHSFDTVVNSYESKYKTSILYNILFQTVCLAVILQIPWRDGLGIQYLAREQILFELFWGNMHCEFLFTEQRKQPCVLMVEDVLPQQHGRSPLYRPLALFTFCMEHVLVLIKLSSIN